MTTASGRRLVRFLPVACVLVSLSLQIACTGGQPGSEHEPRTRPADSEVRAFTRGRWFAGSSFEKKVAYSVDGELTFDRPAAGVDTVIDLAGGYVIPPLGEAHNHNVEYSPRIHRVIRRYLSDGVFYVKNPNNLPRARDAVEGLVNVPESIDVVFGNAGLTGSGGHPAELVERNIERGVWTEADAEGAFYFAIDDEQELERRWDEVLATDPDFIKAYLLYSEEYDERKDDPALFGWRGLDPALLPEIVQRAHRADLRVTAHVETTADFHNALAAGVDEIAHIPGFRGNREAKLPDPSVYEITEADARRAAETGVVVVTTVGGIREVPVEGPDSTLRRKFDRLHTRNLRLLKKHGVTLAIGSDSYADTSVGEVMYLHGLGVFTDLELLNMWSTATPRAIFPDRKIGCLLEGCEASFLVLPEDPLRDFSHVRDIRLRVKEGHVLVLPSEEKS